MAEPPPEPRPESRAEPRAEPLPPRAYLPGLTPRHPEGAFDQIRASVTPGMDAQALARTRAWRAGLDWLSAGYYWEAHEVLEPVWMQAPPNSPERHLVQAAIQCANARLKRRMGRPDAAARIEARVRALLDEVALSRRAQVMGLSPERARVLLAPEP